MELNRYVYAMGNPVNYADPSGYSSFIDYTIKHIKTFTRYAVSQDVRADTLGGAVSSGIGYLLAKSFFIMNQ